MPLRKLMLLSHIGGVIWIDLTTRAFQCWSYPKCSTKTPSRQSPYGSRAELLVSDTECRYLRGHGKRVWLLLILLRPFLLQQRKLKSDGDACCTGQTRWRICRPTTQDGQDEKYSLLYSQNEKRKRKKWPKKLQNISSNKVQAPHYKQCVFRQEQWSNFNQEQ